MGGGSDAVDDGYGQDGEAVGQAGHAGAAEDDRLGSVLGDGAGGFGGDGVAGRLYIQHRNPGGADTAQAAPRP